MPPPATLLLLFPLLQPAGEESCREVWRAEGWREPEQVLIVNRAVQVQVAGRKVWRWLAECHPQENRDVELR